MMRLTDFLIDFYYDYFWLGNKLLSSKECKYYSINDSISDFNPDYIEHINHNILNNMLNDNVKTLRLCLISDTHDRHYLFTQLPICDILIHSGDIFMTGRLRSMKGNIHKLKLFNKWLGMQPAKFKIVIAGNHDSILEELSINEIQSILTNAIYLCNTSITILGLNIFGSPLSYGFSKNRAFQSSNFAKETFNLVNSLKDKEVDILITHGRCPFIGQIMNPNIIHINGHVHRLHGIQLSTTPDNPNDLLENKDYKHYFHKTYTTTVIPLLPINNISNLGDHITDKQYNKQLANNKVWIKAAAPIMDNRYQPNQIPIIIDLKPKQ